jgi:hypothetical protein
VQIPPLKPRLDIVLPLHEWQEKGAPQMLYLCFTSPFNGGILGDEMGLGMVSFHNGSKSYGVSSTSKQNFRWNRGPQFNDISRKRDL